MSSVDVVNSSHYALIRLATWTGASSAIKALGPSTPHSNEYDLIHNSGQPSSSDIIYACLIVYYSTYLTNGVDCPSLGIKAFGLSMPIDYRC